MRRGYEGAGRDRSVDQKLIVTRRIAWGLAVLAGALFIMAFWAQDNMGPRPAGAIGAFGLLAVWQAWRMRALAAKLRVGSDALRERP